MPGLFEVWQPKYAEHGLATFPVREKRPAVRWYLRMGIAASRQLAIRFPNEDAFGIACRRSGITVLDFDSPSERGFADALDLFGRTPLIVRSGSGHWQGWYRNAGERRLVRPDPARPIDLLGDGFVVAPPSRTQKGEYAIVEGSLDDLDRLPTIRPQTSWLSEQTAQPLIEAGKRNEELWRACMRCAPECYNIEDLRRATDDLNKALFYEPLPDAEIEKIVLSAWRKQISGENWFGGGGRVVVAKEEIDRMVGDHSDALLLLMVLRRHHWGRDFVCANAMAEKMGWRIKRFAAARGTLEELGEIVRIRGFSRHGPAVYRFKSGQK